MRPGRTPWVIKYFAVKRTLLNKNTWERNSEDFSRSVFFSNNSHRSSENINALKQMPSKLCHSEEELLDTNSEE